MSTALARKFRIDLTTDLTLAGSFSQLNGVQDFTPVVNPNLVDASAYDTSGSGSSEKTFEDWTADAVILRRLNAGVYDTGQELARTASNPGQFGNACRLGIRWYDKNGGPEAYQGVAIVGWARSQSGVKDLDAVKITFTGTDQPLASISNPGTAATAPIITSVLPSGAAAGALITISGAYFTGTVPTTGVKIGGVNATNWTVVSDQTIVATVPAGTAGSAPVIVTNGAGASTAFPYTRT